MILQNFNFRPIRYVPAGPQVAEKHLESVVYTTSLLGVASKPRTSEPANIAVLTAGGEHGHASGGDHVQGL